MALNNPQSNFEDSIFGPNGTHPAPKTLPYPTQPISTLYGETVAYLIPEGFSRTLSLRCLFDRFSGVES